MKNLFKLKKIKYPDNKKIPETIKNYNAAVEKKNYCMSILCMFIISIPLGYIFYNGFEIVTSGAIFDVLAYMFMGIFLELFLGSLIALLIAYGFWGLLGGFLFWVLILQLLAKILETLKKISFVSFIENIAVSGHAENLASLILLALFTVLPVVLTLVNLNRNYKTAWALREKAYSLKIIEKSTPIDLTHLNNNENSQDEDEECPYTTEYTSTNTNDNFEYNFVKDSFLKRNNNNK